MSQNIETPLGNLIARIMFEKKLSSYAIEKRSGHVVKQGSVIKLKNGTIKNPTKDTLIGLAKGLGEPISLILDTIAGGKGEVAPDSRFENLSLKFSGLSDKKKAKLDPLVEMMDREIERIESLADEE